MMINLLLQKQNPMIMKKNIKSTRPTNPINESNQSQSKNKDTKKGTQSSEQANYFIANLEPSTLSCNQHCMVGLEYDKIRQKEHVNLKTQNKNQFSASILQKICHINQVIEEVQQKIKGRKNLKQKNVYLKRSEQNQPQMIQHTKNQKSISIDAHKNNAKGTSPKEGTETIDIQNKNRNSNMQKTKKKLTRIQSSKGVLKVYNPYPSQVYSMI